MKGVIGAAKPVVRLLSEFSALLSALRASDAPCVDVEARSYSPLLEDTSDSQGMYAVGGLTPLTSTRIAVTGNHTTTLNIPDTVGFNTPGMYGDKLGHLIRTCDFGPGVVWSTHCHNDLGLATANTMAAVSAGCRQAEVTINGIGERAGNTSLEEVAMVVATRPTVYVCARTPSSAHCGAVVAGEASRP